MHTSQKLDSADFTYHSDEKVGSRSEIMPEITDRDRVGVVMGSATEGIDAGNFVLSCVTAFYDHLRATTDDFFEYPDYYTFQTTTDPADYRMLDIYPNHKNVTVKSDTERLMQAIVDRAITILLVPNITAQRPDIEEITRRSLERYVKSCYQYAGSEPLTDADFTIETPENSILEWYTTTFNSTANPSSSSHQTVLEPREEPITQRFRHIELDTALSHLPTGNQ